MGLKGHKRIFGLSLLADGTQKIDYLCKGEVVINGVSFPLVLKVGDANQPLLMGLDVIYSGSMILDFVKMTVSLSSTPVFDPLLGFQYLDYATIMQKTGVTAEDLVQIDELPEPLEAYNEAVKLGQTSLIVFLGKSSGVGHLLDVWAGSSL